METHDYWSTWWRKLDPKKYCWNMKHFKIQLLFNNPKIQQLWSVPKKYRFSKFKTKKILRWSLSVNMPSPTPGIQRWSGILRLEVSLVVQSGFRCIFVSLSWLQRVRNTRKWHAVTKIFDFQKDLRLKYVLCNSLTTTLKFVASRARRPQRTITNVCVSQTPLIFSFVYILPSGDDQERCDFK